MFGSKRSTIAVDAGPASVAICQLARRRAALHVHCCAVAEDPLRARPAAEAAVELAAERAGRMIRQSPFDGHGVSLLLQPPDVAFHALQVPVALRAASRAQWETSLRFEAARHMQAEPDELEVDAWDLPATSRAGESVMLVMTRRSVVERWAAAFESLDLELRCIDALPAVLVRAGFASGVPGATGEAPLERLLWGVLDVGFSRATLTLALGSVCVFVRTLNTGGDALTEAIAAALHVDYRTAESLKRQLSAAPQPAESRGAPAPPDRADVRALLQHVLRTAYRALAHDVERACTYVLETYPAAIASGLYLCGGGARLAGLPEALHESLGVPVQLLNPCERVRDRRARPQHDGSYAVLAACMGLAMGDLA